MGETGEAGAQTARTVLLIGDIHGHVAKLRALWSNLEARVGTDAFRTALVLFLGDYCDRGPHTREVIDFLISLPARYPRQSHVFLCGNHDLAFAAFVGALPPPPDGSPFDATWPEYEANEEREGWFKGEGHERMHVQGRRWGGTILKQWNPKMGMEYKGSIYDASPTFESYGVPHGSPDLAKAMPDDHMTFLGSLVWVHEEENVCIDTPEGRISCKLIAVHAGLEKSKDVHQQMKLLKVRDTSLPKVECLSGRQNVWGIPEELTQEPTIVASGHHGKLYINGLRLIIDESGGIGELPIAAVVLPAVAIVRDTDGIPLQH